MLSFNSLLNNDYLLGFIDFMLVNCILMYLLNLFDEYFVLLLLLLTSVLFHWYLLMLKFNWNVILMLYCIYFMTVINRI
jgi:hypothetical protein